METNQEKRNNKTSMKGISLTTLGWEIAVPIFGGILIGHQLDRYFGMNYIFSISFLVLGIIFGYYNIYKRIKLEVLRTKAAKQQTHQQHNRDGIINER